MLEINKFLQEVSKMIHGGSADPVFVKKISLKVWRLRDEIETVVKERFSDPNNIPPLKDLIREYQETGTILGDSAADEAGVKDASELDDFGEDEMAKAIAAAEAGEDNEEEEAEADDAAQSQDAIDALMESGGEIEESVEETVEIPEVEKKLEIAPEEFEGKMLLKQRRPRMSDDKTHSGRAILSEIYMNEMYFFSNEQFLEGQSIVIDFLVPRRFLMNAVVRYCRSYNMKSRIISKNKHPFRVCVQFSYLKPGERTILRNFVESIEPEVEEIAVPEKKEASDDGGGDDFDIFDDLE